MAKNAPSMGMMRRRVRVLRRTESRDPLGQHIHEWTPIHTNVPAQIFDVGGTETPRGGNQIQSERRTILLIRWFADVRSRDRIETDDGRLLHIVSALDHQGTRRYLRLETVDAGEVPPDA